MAITTIYCDDKRMLEVCRETCLYLKKEGEVQPIQRLEHGFEFKMFEAEYIVDTPMKLTSGGFLRKQGTPK